jgi:hypothetical protein
MSAYQAVKVVEDGERGDVVPLVAREGVRLVGELCGLGLWYAGYPEVWIGVSSSIGEVPTAPGSPLYSSFHASSTSADGGCT